jgi:flagellar basal-body rod modification protein FlgD
MTTISGTNTTTTSTTTAKKDDRAQIAGNFDQFLSLLTTQLKNQSPLEPLDTNQFTQQLVQFAQVEQQLKQNEALTSLLSVNRAASASQAMSFVGSTIVADGSSSRLNNGRAEWQLDAARGGTGIITIKDSKGNVVGTDSVTLSAGQQTYRWNGRNSAGTAMPDGDYSITVDATDTLRNKISVKTEFSGAVQGVDMTGSEPMLNVNGRLLALDKVKTASR